MSHVIAVMYLGKIVESGEAQTLARAPKHPYTEALFSAALPSHPDERREEIILPGEVPSPLQPAVGLPLPSAAVQWRRRQAQPLGAARHGRVVDRLDIDAVAMQQLVAGGLQRPGSPTMTGTMWLGDGITGSPASARRRFKVAARSWWRSRSAWLCLQMADRWRARRRRVPAAVTS